MSQSHRVRLGLTAFCLAMIVLHPIVWWIARDQVIEGLPDFRIFYTAGLILRRGQGSKIYNDDTQLNIQREFVGPARSDDTPLPYNHPPFEALLYVPFTYLSYLRAYFLWDFINLGVLAATIWLLRPWLANLRAEFPRLLFLIPLAFFPIAYTLMQGQDSIMLLAVYGLAYDRLRRERDLEAGAFLGLGLFKFHLVLPFAFILLLRRRWHVIAGLASVASLELAISWLLVGWKQLLYYPSYAWHINRLQPVRIIVPSNMPNLRGLLTGWGWSTRARPSIEIALLCISLVLLTWAARYWQPETLVDEQHWNLGFAIAVIVAFLTGYHGYNQDMSVVFVPVLLTADLLLKRGETGVKTMTKLFLGLMFLSPLYLLLTLHYDHQNLFAVVLLGLAGCLVWLSGQSELTSAPKSTAPFITLVK